MIYLDYAATHPMTPLALEAYTRAAQQVVGNPASVHLAGQRARELLEEGRAAAAAALGVHPLTLIANGGGSEGSNQVLLSTFLHAPPGSHLITSNIEHSATLAPARQLEARGVAVTYLQPDQHGGIDPQQLQQAMRPETKLVSFHLVNNELGSIQDIAAMSRIAHTGGALLHTDAVQAPGVLPLDVQNWGADYVTLSAHKWGGPLGVGLLYIRRGLELPPMILGGGQEKGLRAGTQNTPGLYAAGLSLQAAAQAQPATWQHLRALNDQLTARLATEQGIRANHTPQGSPKVASFTAERTDGEALLMNLDFAGVCVSAGSACSAGTMQPSHVLSALGFSDSEARATVRFSFGPATTPQDIEQAAELFIDAVRRCAVS